MNVKHHTETAEHTDKVDKDTFWSHSGHPREKLQNQTDLLFFVFLFHV